MEIIKVVDNLFLYTLPAGNKNPYSINISVLLDGKQALIIDAGFEKHAAKVKEAFKNDGIEPEIVVLSHYHPDHICGTVVFEGAKVMASEFYHLNIENCKKWAPGCHLPTPGVLIKDGDTLKFGSFDLKFIHTPGHSRCSITTIINSSIINIGDLSMANEDGIPFPPFVCDSTFENYIESLERLIEIKADIMIPAHGPVLVGTDIINARFIDHLYYLKKVWESKGTLPLEECLKQPISNYKRLGFHSRNLENL